MYVCVVPYLDLLAACLQSRLQLPDECVFLPQSGSLLLLTLLLQPLQVPVGLCSLFQLQLFAADQRVQTLMVTNTEMFQLPSPDIITLFIAASERKTATTDVGMLSFFGKVD